MPTTIGWSIIHPPGPPRRRFFLRQFDGSGWNKLKTIPQSTPTAAAKRLPYWCLFDLLNINGWRGRKSFFFHDHCVLSLFSATDRSMCIKFQSIRPIGVSPVLVLCSDGWVIPLFVFQGLCFFYLLINNAILVACCCKLRCETRNDWWRQYWYFFETIKEGLSTYKWWWQRWWQIDLLMLWKMDRINVMDWRLSVASLAAVRGEICTLSVFLTNGFIVDSEMENSRQSTLLLLRLYNVLTGNL